jgi:tetratricopeptide (TPR) repeat protein
MFFAINPKDKDKEERIAQVDELIETAYRHTLTVDLVAHQTAKIEDYGKKTLSNYIKVLKESGINSGINVVVYNNKDDNGKSDIIFEHIRALFNLTALTEKEKYIMVNACLLPLSGMPVAEFESFIDLENYPNSESNDGWGEDSTISNLIKGGWIKRINGEVSKITLHPIVSEVTVNELKPEITEDKCKNFCDSMQELADNCENDLKAVEPYKDLFIKSANLLMKSEDEKTANYLSSVSYVLFNLAYYVDALFYMLKTLVIREEKLPENHPDIASSLNNVGCAYGKLGGDKGYEIECEYCLKALAIREKVLPENHPDIATSLNNIGYAYCELGDPKEALKYLLKALTIREKVLPKNHPDIAESLNNVGSAYGKLGKHDKVFEYKKRALVIWNNELLKNHTECAAPFHHIGVIYGELKCYRKQLEYFNKALTIQEKKLSKNHPEIALLYNNISATYMCLRNYDKALPYMLKAASIFEQTVPKNNAQLAKIYSRISKAYANLGDEKNSEKYLKLYQQYNNQ